MSNLFVFPFHIKNIDYFLNLITGKMGKNKEMLLKACQI